MSASPRILIVRLSSLGDILHTLPAFASLRASYPEAKIDWLTGPKSQSLLSAVPAIDALHVFEADGLLRAPPSRASWRRLRQLLRTLRSQHYDIAIDFQGLLKSAALAALSSSRSILGFSKPLVREWPAHRLYHRTLGKPEAPEHIIALNQRLAALAGAIPAANTPELRIPEPDERLVDTLLRENGLSDYVVLNPGGGWSTKRWGPARYGLLAERIDRDLGLPVLVTTGPGEESQYAAIARNCRKTTLHHFSLSFLQLVPLLKKARLFVGGDTGPFHLACALNTPVVGIFGPTSPVRNGPWRKGEQVAARMVSCGPCYARTCTKNLECMDIAVDVVFECVIRRLQHSRGT